MYAGDNVKKSHRRNKVVVEVYQRTVKWKSMQKKPWTSGGVCLQSPPYRAPGEVRNLHIVNLSLEDGKYSEVQRKWNVHVEISFLCIEYVCIS